jgi:hypothetical protein
MNGGDLLAVGDPRRRAVGRAVFGTLIAAAVFFLFTVPTKQLAPIYDHAPWENDPFDTAYSFAMFFVPLLAACLLVQVSLCRKSEPLMVSRVISILRACRIAIATIVITLLSCWSSVLLGENRSQWTRGATAFLIAFLVVVTGLTGIVIVRLFRAPTLRVADRTRAARGSDWLGDVITVAERESRWCGPLRPVVINLVDWSNRKLVAWLRRHPLLGAAVASLVFGLAVGINQGLRERYVLSATALTVCLLSCGMFAFLVIAGSYFGAVQSSAPWSGIRRRALDAGVCSCIAVIVSLAFRNSLWWIVSSDQSAAGTGQFAGLLGITILVAFATVFGLESSLHAHAEREPELG